MGRMPKQWLVAGTKIEGTVKVEGKSKTIDMSADVYGKGLCPSCHEPMEGPVFCGGRPMQVCWTDRVALPYPDEQHKQFAAGYTPYEEPEPNFFGT